MVRGKAFFKKVIKPFLKFLLFISWVKDSVCLIECKKQKYTVKASKGSKFILRIITVKESNKDSDIKLLNLAVLLKHSEFEFADKRPQDFTPFRGGIVINDNEMINTTFDDYDWKKH